MKSSVKSQQTQATKEKIIKSALDLFNKKGTVAVTTHDIAEAAEISPGNLYYHFKNKEEIIRNIFAEIEIFSEPHWATYGPRNPKVGIMDFMRFFVGSLKKYQFFFREFSRLLQNDPALAKQWKMSYKNLSEIMRGAVHLWTENGIIKKFSTTEEVTSFIDNCWTILTFSSVYVEARESGPSFEKTEKLFLRFLYPYHTIKGQKAIDLYSRP